jgi:hypothetical protein
MSATDKQLDYLQSLLSDFAKINHGHPHAPESKAYQGANMFRDRLVARYTEQIANGLTSSQASELIDDLKDGMHGLGALAKKHSDIIQAMRAELG